MVKVKIKNTQKIKSITEAGNNNAPVTAQPV
jgi:hypothetical protein